MKVSPILQVIGILLIVVAAFATDVILGVAAVGGVFMLVGHYTESD